MGVVPDQLKSKPAKPTANVVGQVAAVVKTDKKVIYLYLICFVY